MHRSWAAEVMVGLCRCVNRCLCDSCGHSQVSKNGEKDILPLGNLEACSTKVNKVVAAACDFE